MRRDRAYRMQATADVGLVSFDMAGQQRVEMVGLGGQRANLHPDPLGRFIRYPKLAL